MTNRKWLKGAAAVITAVLALAVSPVYGQSASDFTVDANGVITKYSGFDTDVVILATIGGKRITAIGDRAFERADLTSVTIPEGVTEIGNSAFQGNKLTAITFPSTVKKIGADSFKGNTGITTIVIPEGVETVYGGAFYGTSYNSVSIPSTIKEFASAFELRGSPSFTFAANINIDFASFAQIFDNYIANDRRAGTYTPAMKSVSKETDEYEYKETEYGAILTRYKTIPAATRVRIPAEIGGVAVKALYETYNRRSSIVAVQIPEGITYIGGGTFYQCQLENVTIPSSVTYIGGSAFGKNKLTSLTVPAGVLYIGQNAFEQNELASVTITSSVLYIDDYAFSVGAGMVGNPLTSLTIAAGVTYIGRSAFSGNRLTSFTVPSSVLYIGYEAFNGLSTITIPPTVRALGGLPISINRSGNSIVLSAGAGEDILKNLPSDLAALYRRHGAGRYTVNIVREWTYSAR